MKNAVALGVGAVVENGAAEASINGGKCWLPNPLKKDNGNGVAGKSKENGNGFEAWRGYIEAKKSKLNAQFHTNGTTSSHNIFEDICITCNGLTEPPEPELRQLFVKYGGTYMQYRNSRTTFVIASNLSATSKNLYAGITVKPEWIIDSIEAGVRLNYQDYLLYNLNEENNQRTLTQIMPRPARPSAMPSAANSRGRQMLELAKKTSSKSPAVMNGNSSKAPSLVSNEQQKTAKNGQVSAHSAVSNGKPTTISPSSPNSFYGKNRSKESDSPPPEIIELSPPRTKRRKLDFDNSTKTTTEIPQTDNNEGNPPIDVNVLLELPDDIAREIAQQYGIDIDHLNIIPKDQNNDNTGLGIPWEVDAVLNEDQTSPVSLKTNPYEEIDSIDPGYLCALPEALRNEVLLQFQEAKGRKGESLTQVSIANGQTLEPQPCSSRQALERDEGLKSMANRKPIQSKDPCYVAPLGIMSPKNYLKLRCNEKMCDEIVYTTPPKLSSPRNLASPNRFKSRQEVTPSLAARKKRLDFGEVSKDNPIAPPNLVVDDDENNLNDDEILSLKKFWNDKKSPTTTTSYKKQSKSVVPIPTLNGAIKIEEVRDQIREAIAALPNPTAVDTQSIEEYFKQLVSGHYLKQLEVLLKFLFRQHDSLLDKSAWRPVIQGIVTSAQAECIASYDYMIELE